MYEQKQGHVGIKTPDGVITIQEMFDRAWKGLEGQGWAKCMYADGTGCSYDGIDGKKCAWGWVDPEGTKSKPEYVDDCDFSMLKLYEPYGVYPLGGTVLSLAKKRHRSREVPQPGIRHPPGDGPCGPGNGALLCCTPPVRPRCGG